VYSLIRSLPRVSIKAAVVWFEFSLVKFSVNTNLNIFLSINPTEEEHKYNVQRNLVPHRFGSMFELGLNLHCTLIRLWNVFALFNLPHSISIPMPLLCLTYSSLACILNCIDCLPCPEGTGKH